MQDRIQHWAWTILAAVLVAMILDMVLLNVTIAPQIAALRRLLFTAIDVLTGR